jgi:hypothetical protein
VKSPFSRRATASQPGFQTMGRGMMCFFHDVLGCAGPTNRKWFIIYIYTYIHTYIYICIHIYIHYIYICFITHIGDIPYILGFTKWDAPPVNPRHIYHPWYHHFYGWDFNLFNDRFMIYGDGWKSWLLIWIDYFWKSISMDIWIYFHIHIILVNFHGYFHVFYHIINMEIHLFEFCHWWWGNPCPYGFPYRNP